MPAWRALDLTQGSAGDSVRKLLMRLSLSIKNLKSNKNIYLFISVPWLSL